MAKITDKQMGAVLNDLRRVYTFAFPASDQKADLEIVKNLWLEHFGKYTNKQVRDAAYILRATSERPSIAEVQDIIYQTLGIVPSIADIRAEVQTILRTDNWMDRGPLTDEVLDAAGGVYQLKALPAKEQSIAIQTVIKSVRESAIMTAVKNGK